MELFENEKLEDLECDGLKIIQNKKLYNFTCDSVILANFLHIKAGETAVEIGSGSSVISILASAKNKDFKKIYDFEIQEEISNIAKRNLKINKLDEKIEVFNEKIQNFDKFLNKNSIDVVFTNPPYFRYLEAKTSKRDCGYDNISKYDKCLSLKDLCECTSRLLKDKGRFYIVYSAERSSELIYELIKNNLEPKTMFFTENGKGKVVLVVIEAVKGGKHGVKVFPNLNTNEENGDYLEKLKTKYFK